MSGDVDKLLQLTQKAFEAYVDAGEHSDQDTIDLWIEAKAEKERADKLQEAINQAIKEYGLWNDKAHAADVMAALLAEFRSSLYPKEEETK